MIGIIAIVYWPYVVDPRNLATIMSDTASIIVADIRPSINVMLPLAYRCKSLVWSCVSLIFLQCFHYIVNISVPRVRASKRWDRMVVGPRL